MAVRLDVTLTGLRVRLSGVDLVAAASRGVFLPFGRVVGVRVMNRADAVASSPGVPCPGAAWSGRWRLGRWGIGGRRQLWSARGGGQVLVIDLTGRPFHRVVVEVDDAGSAQRRLGRALQHSRSSRARQPVRDLPTLIADEPGRYRAAEVEGSPPGTSRHALGPPGRGERAHGVHVGTWLRAVARAVAAAGVWQASGDRTGSPGSDAGDNPGEGRGRRAGTAGHPARPAITPSSAPGVDPGVAARLRLYEYRTRRTVRLRDGSTRPAPERASSSRPPTDQPDG